MALSKNPRPIHPFPARMAQELVWAELPVHSKRLRVLDPMAGSGTTLVTAKLRGHEVIGYDRDPLAVLIARSWLAGVEPEKTKAKATEILSRARNRVRELPSSEAYPRKADNETKEFVRYWFDDTNRTQLAALSDSIFRIHDSSLRDLMWCALSRLIITKSRGVSLATDVSHSRPHRSYDTAPITLFDHFEHSVERIVKAAPFSKDTAAEAPSSVSFADARKLPIGSNSIDIVITSPPYLNAIDYIRGHKFSLIWMGHSIRELREIRSTNVGTETASKHNTKDEALERIMTQICFIDKLTNRQIGMLRQYVTDMKAVLSEVNRVLRHGGKAVFVLGNCNLCEAYVQNSMCVEKIATELGMNVDNIRSRPLPENRRYLPPPGSSRAGTALKKRMREEVILTLLKN